MQHVQAIEIGIVASPSSAVAVASSRQRMPSLTRAQVTSTLPSSARPSISRSATPQRRPSSAVSTASSRADAVSPLSAARKPVWNHSQP